MKEADGVSVTRGAATDGTGLYDRRALLVIPLLALFVVHPLIVHGCSCGHDFDFHLLNWFEAATQIGHGNLHPHWAFTPAWDAGEPRFVFYPPVSWYLGALLGLVFTHLPGVSEAAAWTAVPIAFVWLALTLSGLTMFRFARAYASGNIALVAAAIYMANPYMLFTAFERSAYGELLAAAWMPLLFDGILRERTSIARIAVPVALLWLTNAPAAVMGCYALALLALVRAARQAGITADRAGMVGRRTLRPAGFALRIASGVLLGLAAAACYIVPAVYEGRYVHAAMATIGGMRIDANFLFEHTGSTPDDLLHDQVLRTASWIAIVLLAATATALIAAWLRKRKTPAARSLPVLPLATLTTMIAFMLTPMSALFWHRLPEMAYLQFSWRLLALIAPVFALAVALVLRGAVATQSASSSTRIVLVSLVLCAALGLPAWHLFRQPCDPEDTAAARLALYHSNAGTDPTDEYTPATPHNDMVQAGNPSWWLTDSVDADGKTTRGTVALRTAPMHVAISAPHAAFVIR